MEIQSNEDAHLNSSHYYHKELCLSEHKIADALYKVGRIVRQLYLKVLLLALTLLCGFWLEYESQR